MQLESSYLAQPWRSQPQVANVPPLFPSSLLQGGLCFYTTSWLTAPLPITSPIQIF